MTLNKVTAGKTLIGCPQGESIKAYVWFPQQGRVIICLEKEASWAMNVQLFLLLLVVCESEL